MTHGFDQPSPARSPGDESPRTHMRRRLLLAAVGALTVAAGSLPALGASAAASGNGAKVTATAQTGSGRYQALATAPFYPNGTNKEKSAENYVKRTDTHRVKKSTEVRHTSAPAVPPVLAGPNFNGANETQAGGFPP